MREREGGRRRERERELWRWQPESHHAPFPAVGSPLSPNEGKLLITCDDASMSLIIRVMDEDWLSKDDLLGEVMVRDVGKLVEQGGATFDLTFKGKETKSTLTVKASWQPNSTQPHLLSLVAVTALGLRSADGILSRNDVYIQAYPVPKDFDPNAASSRASSKASRGSTGPMLPEPAKQTVLPSGDYTFELPELKLPDRAPGSFEINTCRYPRWHNHDYVHSHIRHPITVAYWSPPLPADESLLEVGITSRRPLTSG